MWRRSLALVALFGALLTGCDDDSPRDGAIPTSRTSGAAGSTTSSTVPPADGQFVGAGYGDKDLWAITTEPCARPEPGGPGCGVVWRSSDSAVRWTRLARLEVATSADGTTDYVSAVHFADARHGWVYDRSLFATFNGGRRWQRVDLGNPVVALESFGPSAYALVGACGQGVGNCNEPMRLFEGTVSTGRWRFLTLDFELPYTDVGNLVASRSGLYAVVVRGLDQIFMARTGNGRWERRGLPCPRALVAAIQNGDGLVAACRPPAPTGPVELLTSSDGGRTWAVVWQQTFPSPLSSLVVTSQATVVGLESGEVLRSTDSGMTFVNVAHTGVAPTIRFEDAERGTVLGGPPGRRHLFRTGDGGETWQVVTPPE